jgi:hypothetical protein
MTHPVYITYPAIWQGIPLEVRYAPMWSPFSFDGHKLVHLEVQSQGRVPLPITGTGYRSHFMHVQPKNDITDPVAFVLAWLDAEAKAESWKATVQASRQGCLF